VVRDEVVRLDHLPFVARLPGLPVLMRGRRIEVDVLGSDEVDTTLELRLHRVLADSCVEVLDDDVAVLEGPAHAAKIDSPGAPVPQGG
jgi:hypothetical protein